MTRRINLRRHVTPHRNGWRVYCGGFFVGHLVRRTNMYGEREWWLRTTWRQIRPRYFNRRGDALRAVRLGMEAAFSWREVPA